MVEFENGFNDLSFILDIRIRNRKVESVSYLTVQKYIKDREYH